MNRIYLLTVFSFLLMSCGPGQQSSSVISSASAAQNSSMTSSTQSLSSGQSISTMINSSISISIQLSSSSGSSSISNIIKPAMETNIKIIFLHHSTGGVIWGGGVSEWFQNYNSSNKVNYNIIETAFPKSSPYGWNNYPYDYWNIWVNHAGPTNYMEEPTLEILTTNYQIIIWKHCYPVSSINADTGDVSISSEEKKAENYKLQYNALKVKMHEYPSNRFIVWTGAAQVSNATDTAAGNRTRDFFNWVKNTWDESGDNIYIWDFYELETEGGIYIKNEYAVNEGDSHPNSAFAQMTAPYFCHRIVDVIQGNGDISNITGK